jgi:hypothetical protein
MSERDAAREILRELLHEALAGGNGHGATPAVPPPPVAAVLRPSTWSAPPTGAETIGDAGHPSTEPVAIESDDDLQRFVHALLARFENPADREAIRSGRLRFTLGRAGGGAAPGAGRGDRAAPPGTLRVERGAVTERKVEEAARAGARLVLGPGAVLTPLAREKARAKGIAIERER